MLNCAVLAGGVEHSLNEALNSSVMLSAATDYRVHVRNSRVTTSRQ